MQKPQLSTNGGGSGVVEGVDENEVLTIPKLIKYQPSTTHDILIAGAYYKMAHQGDLYEIVPSGKLSELFATIQSPSHVYFKLDTSNQIWFLSWYELNYLLGRLMVLWMDDRHRKSKEGYTAILEVINKGLTEYGEILAITADPKIVEGAVRIGYTVIGKIDAIGQDRRDRWIIRIKRKPTQ